MKLAPLAVVALAAIVPAQNLLSANWKAGPLNPQYVKDLYQSGEWFSFSPYADVYRFPDLVPLSAAAWTLVAWQYLKQLLDCFAVLHYDLINPAGAPLNIYGFLFRFSASVIFCLLFLFRGFGIAVGTHVIYDVMTQL